MKILDFCEAYKAKKFMSTKQGDEERIAWLKNELGVKGYLPFSEKRELCKMVIDACCKKENGLVKVDSVTRYIVFTISVISRYTTLEFSSGEDSEYDSLDEYDMLCENRMLDVILAMLGDEYTACNNMLNMMMDDIMTNNNTVESVLGHVFDKVSDSLDDLISALADKIDDLNIDFSQLDIDKYKGLLDLLPKK
jgi:hypothetical protein